MTGPPIRDTTTVRLHPLRIRRDGDEYCVGRIATGEFVMLAPVAVDALRLLGRGLSVTAARRELRMTRGTDVDLGDFVANLVELGFVAAVDDDWLTGPDPIRPTLVWLRPAHVKWTLRPATALVAITLPLCAMVTAVLSPQLLPSYRDLLWSDRGGVVIAGNAAIAWTLILLHELGHLATARAAGVPARMSLGTRLQFLVAQTDVTGVWAAPRRTRLTVYLAGVAVTVAIGSCALLGRAVLGPDGPAGQILGAVGLTALLSLPAQLLVFMRTDLYFVLQDLSGCRNLYADGSAYTAFLIRRCRRRHALDPTTTLPRIQRRAVRAYTPVLVVGTAACLTVAALVTIPVAATLLTRGATDLAAGRSLAQRLDGLITVAIVSTIVTLWTLAWWRRHGARVRGWRPPDSPRKQRGGEHHGDNRHSQARQD